MTDKNQTRGREANGAMPLGKPDPAASEASVKRTAEREQTSAGPDGPDAAEIGDTFKQTGKSG